MNLYENINNQTCGFCKKEINYCNCITNNVSLYTCDLCLLKEECVEKIDTLCVVYNLNELQKYSGIKCLGLLSNTNLHTILDTIGNKICSIKDEKVKVSENDTKLDYLMNKILLDSCLYKNIINVNQEEKLYIGINYSCLCSYISNCNVLLLTLLLVLTLILNLTLILTPILTLMLTLVLILVLTLINYCNNILSWLTLVVICNNDNTTTIKISVTNNIGQQVEFYDYSLLGNTLYNLNGWVNGQTLSTYTSLTEFLSNNSINNFKARIKNCSTYIDGSVYSCNLQNITYTANRTSQFIKNNCLLGCALSTVTFTKTYSSNISQLDANTKAVNDNLFNIEGQAYANSNGSCTCSLILLLVLTLVLTLLLVLNLILTLIQMVWNLRLCSDNSNATYQVNDSNLSSGIVLKDNTSGLCYYTVNMGLITGLLLNSYYETGGDCSSCLSILTLILTLVPTPTLILVPIPILVLTPTLTPVLTLTLTLVLTLTILLVYTLSKCSDSSFNITNINISGLNLGTIVKLSDNNCYSVTGTTNILTSNTILSIETDCSSCLGILTLVLTLTPVLILILVLNLVPTPTLTPTLVLILVLTLVLTLILALTPTLTLVPALTLTLVLTLVLALLTLVLSACRNSSQVEFSATGFGGATTVLLYDGSNNIIGAMNISGSFATFTILTMINNETYYAIASNSSGSSGPSNVVTTNLGMLIC